MGSKSVAMLYMCMFCMLLTLPPAYSWQKNCPPPYRPHPPSPPKHHPRPPKHPRPHPPSPPHHGGGVLPPIVNPPIIVPPITNPPGTRPPPSSSYPPYTPPGGGGKPPPAATCPIDALKLGLCLDVLGGLVHVGIGNPVENICCPVLQGLLELEAAICLCTTIRLKLLNLNIFLPLALQVLATCGLTPPPGFVCPPL
ncbi:Bifunctional inhibitor/lipid-transfer protein/seed storage 2S albumin superfamily protein [Perilla frutescens var. frutescens]|nr:Bifunctional inhibitor/lipid-transfer protein/seed storage 2S albumin superfamily protein [Perilla frutescens var. frutescens]